jgi:outer membrane murein-binding lipoprotein Lpp
MEWLIGLVAAAIPFAILLACPVGMFLAMRFGMSWMAPGCAHERDVSKLGPAERLTHLERQQAHLAREIDSTRAQITSEQQRAARA